MMRPAICIPYRPRDDRERQFLYVLEHYAAAGCAVYVSGDGLPEDQPMNRAAAVNRAATAAIDEGQATLFIADADTFVPLPQLEEAVRLAQHGCLALAYTGYVRLSHTASDRVMAGATPPGYLAGLENHVSGALAVSVQSYLQVGGFDERFQSWGGEDRAFWMACRTLLAPPRRVVGRAYHLWHPPAPSRSPSFPGYQDVVDLGVRYKQASGWLTRGGMLPAVGMEDRVPDIPALLALLREPGGPLEPQVG